MCVSRGIEDYSGGDIVSVVLCCGGGGVEGEGGLDGVDQC